MPRKKKIPSNLIVVSPEKWNEINVSNKVKKNKPKEETKTEIQLSPEQIKQFSDNVTLQILNALVEGKIKNFGVGGKMYKVDVTPLEVANE